MPGKILGTMQDWPAICGMRVTASEQPWTQRRMPSRPVRAAGLRRWEAFRLGTMSEEGRSPARYAADIDEARDRLIAFAESCTSEQWHAAPVRATRGRLVWEQIT